MAINTDSKLSEFADIILEAVPLPILVTDADVRIQRANRAADQLLGGSPQAYLGKRGGEALHCLHSTDVPAGCGRAEFCKDCVVRNSVVTAAKGGRVHRQQTMMTLVSGATRTDVQLLVSTAPFDFEGRPHAVLVLEDISEFTKLRQLIPICASCKRIRDNENHWHQFESYLSKKLQMDTTHGLCPDCVKKYFPN